MDDYSHRKQFIMFTSYVEIYQKLKTLKRKNRFMDKIIQVQYGFCSPSDVDFSDDYILSLVWDSIKHSLVSQVAGVKGIANGQEHGQEHGRYKDKDKDKDKDKPKDKGKAPLPFFKSYMDVLDYLKERGEANYNISVKLGDIIVKVSKYGIAYNSETMKDLDHVTETTFLTYLKNNQEEIK